AVCARIAMLRNTTSGPAGSLDHGTYEQRGIIGEASTASPKRNPHRPETRHRPRSWTLSTGHSTWTARHPIRSPGMGGTRTFHLWLQRYTRIPDDRYDDGGHRPAHDSRHDRLRELPTPFLGVVMPTPPNTKPGCQVLLHARPDR